MPAPFRFLAEFVLQLYHFAGLIQHGLQLLSIQREPARFRNELHAGNQRVGLSNMRNIYLVPYEQDSPKGKPNSLVARM
jgi:hypothetical protein